MKAKIVTTAVFDHGNLYVAYVFYACGLNSENPLTCDLIGLISVSVNIGGVRFLFDRIDRFYMLECGVDAPVGIYMLEKQNKDDLSKLFEVKDPHGASTAKCPEVFISYIKGLQEVAAKKSNIIDMLDWKRKKDRQQFQNAIK